MNEQEHFELLMTNSKEWLAKELITEQTRRISFIKKTIETENEILDLLYTATCLIKKMRGE